MFIEFVTILLLFCFVLFWGGCILAPSPAIEPSPLHWKGKP